MDDDNHVEDNNNKERKPTIEKIITKGCVPDVEKIT